jgi:enoyl-CoA hydratase
MEFKNLLSNLQDGTLILTINREAKLNALNLETVQEIGQAFDEVYSNPDIKGVILTGAGDKSFVAGADISEIAHLSQADAAAFARRGQATFAKIENCPKPVIAAVNGYALGGGCELAMACHIRVASSNAILGLPEVSLGIIPGYGGTQRLTMLVGKGRALELITTAGKIDAAKATAWGLVNETVAPEALMETCLGMLSKAYRNAPVAIAKAIASVNAHYNIENGYATEANAFGDCCETSDFKEGTTAFLEKRKAKFTGK